MTDDKRLEEIIEYLTMGHLDWAGGYPYDYAWFGSKLAIASLDPGKDYRRTQIILYEKRRLIAWHKRAEKFAKQYPDYSLNDRLAETAPS